MGKRYYLGAKQADGRVFYFTALPTFATIRAALAYLAQTGRKSGANLIIENRPAIRCGVVYGTHTAHYSAIDGKLIGRVC